MLPLSPDSSRPVALTPRMTLRLDQRWQGSASVAPAAAVLSDDQPATTTQFSLFAPAEPAVELDVQSTPRAGVLGAEESQASQLEYVPQEDAVYVLLQEVQTPDGIIYDWTLPHSSATSGPAILGDTTAPAGVLHFPINPVVMGGASGATPGVLGVEDLITGAISGVVLKRALQVFKSPIERALMDGVKHAENEPCVLALRSDFQPLDGFEAWRALLPPGGERRVLLYIHGFASSTTGSAAGLLPQLASGYDAVLGYNHPTISRDPLQNALDLLAMIPDDLQLSVDLVAHSRGGLVARSIVELAGAVQKFRPRVLVTHGTPHGGTRLADPERWDRLISLGMTAASWLGAATGVAVWVPKLLEYVLKAAAQGIFALPGIAAMTPGGDFITRLNAASTTPQPTRYAAVTSSFSVFNVKQPSFRQAFQALSAQAFLDAPNDLVVPTTSMSAIDLPGQALPPAQQFKAAVDHFSYFDDPAVIAFLRSQLGDGTPSHAAAT